MKDVLIIGVGGEGCKSANKLFKEGYNCLAIHADYVLEKELDCPQINLFERHWRPNEYPGFTDNPDNVKELVEENKDYITDIILALIASKIE